MGFSGASSGLSPGNGSIQLFQGGRAHSGKHQYNRWHLGLGGGECFEAFPSPGSQVAPVAPPWSSPCRDRRKRGIFTRISSIQPELLLMANSQPEPPVDPLQAAPLTLGQAGNHWTSEKPQE